VKVRCTRCQEIQSFEVDDPSHLILCGECWKQNSSISPQEKREHRLAQIMERLAIAVEKLIKTEEGKHEHS
jgi:hypothetical protein